MIYIPTTDNEYKQWFEANRERGFVVNSDKAATRSDLPMLHTATCDHAAYLTEKGYVEQKTFKLCSIDKDELVYWMRQLDRRELKSCKDCKP